VAGILELFENLAAAIRTISDEVPGLQVSPFVNLNPTPPSIDLLPGDPFQIGAGFGVGETQVFIRVRARVTTADSIAGQQLLLRMLDPNDPASVEAAMQDVAVMTNEGGSGYREYIEDVATTGRLLGAEWSVSAFL